MKQNDFDLLLKTHEAMTNDYKQLKQEAANAQKEERYKATKIASLEDLMIMISSIVSNTFNDITVEFVPDEGAGVATNPTMYKKDLDKTYIYYSLISREPLNELKPRYRELVQETSDDESTNRQGSVYGQKFKCYVQFDIFACDYKTANEVMNRFEGIIFSYTGLFKKNGVSELVFYKQLTDENLNLHRNTFSIRSIQYYCEIEKLIPIFNSNIKAILDNNTK